MADDEDFEFEDYHNRWIGPRRYLRARARSCAPGNYKHYDNLATDMYDNYQQTQSSSSNKYESSSSNLSSLQRAARALSESRDYVRESSVVPEEKLSTFNRTYRLEDIKDGFSAARDNSDLYEMGNYKITVAPRANSWITPSTFNYSPQSRYTNALLEAYNPSNFPDFVFGQYGVNSSGGITSRPISATQNYYNKHPLLASKFEEITSTSDFPRLRQSSILDDSSDFFSSSAAAKKSSSSTLRSSTKDYGSLARDYHSLAKDSLIGDRDSYAKEFNRTAAAKPTSAAREFLLNSCAGGLVRDREYGARSFGGVTRAAGSGKRDAKSAVKDFIAAAAAGQDEENGITRYNPYESDTFRTPLPRTSRFSKFFHYYIPKHYGGTPMLGGYLVPRAGDYSWRY